VFAKELPHSLVMCITGLKFNCKLFTLSSICSVWQEEDAKDVPINEMGMFLIMINSLIEQPLVIEMPPKCLLLHVDMATVEVPPKTFTPKRGMTVRYEIPILSLPKQVNALNKVKYIFNVLKFFSLL